MQHRPLPKYPETRIPILGFGCMRLPIVDHDMARIDEERAESLIRSAVSRGVTYLDTAYPYHDGNSERFVGRLLAAGLRDRVLLATELPIWLVQVEADFERFIDEQLQRLRTDRIDFYMFHGLSADRWETRQAAARPRRLRARAGRRPDPARRLLVPRVAGLVHDDRRRLRLGLLPDPVQLHGRGVRGRHRRAAARGGAPRRRVRDGTAARRAAGRASSRAGRCNLGEGGCEAVAGGLGAAVGLEPPGRGDGALRYEHARAARREHCHGGVRTRGRAQRRGAVAVRRGARRSSARRCWSAARPAGTACRARAACRFPTCSRTTTRARCSTRIGWRRLSIVCGSWAGGTAPTSARAAANASRNARSRFQSRTCSRRRTRTWRDAAFRGR